MDHVLSRFMLDGCPISCERYGEGHINRTYLVITDFHRRKNKKGERFMLGKHELNELAPRDIVARFIYKELHQRLVAGYLLYASAAKTIKP